SPPEAARTWWTCCCARSRADKKSCVCNVGRGRFSLILTRCFESPWASRWRWLREAHGDSKHRVRIREKRPRPTLQTQLFLSALDLAQQHVHQVLAASGGL